MTKVDKFPRRHWLTYLYCLAGDLLCWLLVLLIWVFAGKGKLLLVQNGLWCAVSRDSFLAKTIFKGVSGGTMGHGGWYIRELIGEDGIDTRLEYHEHIHVEQFEAVMLVDVFILAGQLIDAVARGQLSEVWVMLLVYWTLGGLLGVLSGWIVAMLRGERAYRGSAHEEAAYALERGFRKGEEK